MFKTLIITLSCALVFAMQPKASFGQDFGRPVMAKIAQYTALGGAGGVAVMTVIWITDPLNPEYRLLDFAIIGMGIGFMAGFGWGVYSSVLNAKNYTKHRKTLDQQIQQDQKNNPQSDKEKKNNEYLDYGNLFDDDRNYFDQPQDEFNHNYEVPLYEMPYEIPAESNPGENGIRYSYQYDSTLKKNRRTAPEYSLTIPLYQYQF